MKISWLSKEEVLSLTGWTDRHLRRAAQSGSVASRTSAKLYRGQPMKEYSLASLPDDARRKYLDAHQPEPQPEPVLTASPLAIAAQAAPQQAEPVRVALPPKAEQQAMQRLAVIKPLIEYSRDRAARDKFHKLALKDGELVTNLDSLARYLSEQHSIARSTIWDWYSRFQKGGSTALARKPRADKHRSTWAAENRELADIATLVYLGTPEQPAQSVRVAWEEVCERAERMGVDKPSYETVRAFLHNPNEVSPSLSVYGRSGRKAYDAQFAPYLRRGYAEPANSIWVSDHMIHDIFCQNDVFGARDLKHIRLQMTTILDYRSRYVVGVSWCENGSSHSIKRALLWAFTRYGLPDQFYCDNGKDYRKVSGPRPDNFAEMATAADACLNEMRMVDSSVMQRLGIPVTYCTPYHPQAKHIERYHRTVHDRFDRSFATYSGGATHLRPDSTSAALAKHGKLLTMGRPADSPLPLASHFIAMCKAWIENWYHQQPHSGEGMDNRTPAEVFAQERRAVERPCPDAADLAMLLAERERRKVRNCAVDLAGARFVPADHYADFRMHEYSGRIVTVAYDPLEPNFAAVLDEDLNFVCKLQREELMRFSDDQETRERLAGFLETRNGLRKAARESLADLNRRVRSGGFTTLAEQHEARLQLPRAVGDLVVQPPAPEQTTFKQNHSEDNVDAFFQTLQGGH